MPDLASLKPVPADVAERAQIAAELQAGVRCQSCSERITAGFHVFLLTPKHSDGRVMVETRRIAVCGSSACDEYRTDAMADATYSTRVAFVWHDDAG